MFSYTVFIPRVFSNIKETRISNVFHNLNIGSVDHVDLVSKTSKDGKTYNMAFVHFAMIYNTVAGDKFRSDIEGPDKKAQVAYDGQWFWHVLPFEQKQPSGIEDVFNEQQPYLMAPQLTHQQMDFVMSHMMPVWMMTPYGARLQLGCPEFMLYSSQSQDEQHHQQTNTNTNNRPFKRMVPRQVAYKAIYNGQRNQPRKRLNAPRPEPRPEHREDTYARENVSIDDTDAINNNDNSDSEKEDGEC